MQQSLTLLSAEVSVRIAQDEPNRSKEITLPRTIATNDNIVLGRKGLNDRLVLVAVVIRRLAIVPTESGVDVDISHTS